MLPVEILDRIFFFSDFISVLNLRLISPLASLYPSGETQSRVFWFKFLEYFLDKNYLILAWAIPIFMKKCKVPLCENLTAEVQKLEPLKYLSKYFSAHSDPRAINFATLTKDIFCQVYNLDIPHQKVDIDLEDESFCEIMFLDTNTIRGYLHDMHDIIFYEKANPDIFYPLHKNHIPYSRENKVAAFRKGVIAKNINYDKKHLFKLAIKMGTDPTEYYSEGFLRLLTDPEDIRFLCSYVRRYSYDDALYAIEKAGVNSIIVKETERGNIPIILHTLSLGVHLTPAVAYCLLNYLSQIPEEDQEEFYRKYHLQLPHNMIGCIPSSLIRGPDLISRMMHCNIPEDAILSHKEDVKLDDDWKLLAMDCRAYYSRNNYAGHGCMLNWTYN